MLNLFDRFGVIEGFLESLNLILINNLPDHLIDSQLNTQKADIDKKRLYDLFQYIKSTQYRRQFIHDYFDMSLAVCGNCYNCNA